MSKKNKKKQTAGQAFGVGELAPLTAGYARMPYATYFMNAGKRPMWVLWYVDLMLTDPQVWFGAAIGNAPLFSAEIEVECKDDEVREFLEEQWRKLWRSSASKIVKTKFYGFSGFEVVYRLRHGKIEVEGLIDLHARDTRPVTVNGRMLGINVYGGRKPLEGQPAVMAWGGKRIQLRGPKALWLTFKAEHASLFGRSILERAFAPWWDKCMDGGALDLRRLHNIKDAWIGDIIRVPLSKTIQQPDGTLVSYRDIARELIENRMSGAVMVMDSARDDKGEFLMDYTPPTSIGTGTTDITPWIHDLDADIFDGLLVPREVVEAATSGSGFSGRSIPMQMFLTTRDEEFADYVREISHQIFYPLAVANFGQARADFAVHPRPLLETFGDQQDKGGDDSQGDDRQPQQDSAARFAPRFNGPRGIRMAPEPEGATAQMAVGEDDSAIDDADAITGHAVASSRTISEQINQRFNVLLKKN